MVHSLRHGAAEAIEAVAHGDSNSSKVVGKTVEAIDLPGNQHRCHCPRGGGADRAS